MPELKANPNVAIILPSHTVGFDISQVDWDLGQMVTVLPAPATKYVLLLSLESLLFSYHHLNLSLSFSTGPLLWRGGRMGGELAYPLGSPVEDGANFPVGIRETRFYLPCLGVHRKRTRLSYCWLKMVHFS